MPKTILELTEKEFEIIRLGVALLLSHIDKYPNTDIKAMTSLIEKFVKELKPD